MPTSFYENSAFSAFEKSTEIQALAKGLVFSLDQPTTHPLCLLAAGELQLHLQQQQDWTHNFGLSPDAEGAIIGKMFGVLVVRTKQGDLGYLSAFSGKLAGGNHHAKLVPPIFDGVAPGGFLNAGMEKLAQISAEISALESLKQPGDADQIRHLKSLRKSHSIALQDKIFDQYHFLNRSGQSKSLIDAFFEATAKKPPAGAGECAAPKLLQYAFRYEMEPLALAEFWWGASPKSTYWKHGHFYLPCQEKCAPILAHMLSS